MEVSRACPSKREKPHVVTPRKWLVESLSAMVGVDRLLVEKSLKEKQPEISFERDHGVSTEFIDQNQSELRPDQNGLGDN